MLGERLEESRELDLVLSVRYLGVWSCLVAENTGPLGEEAGRFAPPGVKDLEKKPRMLRCLPVETVPDFLAAEVGLAGVRAADALSVIFALFFPLELQIPAES